ncbi:hypothetical protein DB459_19855 [Bradyrhizobium sp. WD16]|nr:hypothetical protein DB459_19855 [Bradyrhizobium sp. WD16]
MRVLIVACFRPRDGLGEVAVVRIGAAAIRQNIRFDPAGAAAKTSLTDFFLLRRFSTRAQRRMFLAVPTTR